MHVAMPPDQCARVPVISPTTGTCPRRSSAGFRGLMLGAPGPRTPTNKMTISVRLRAVPGTGGGSRQDHPGAQRVGTGARAGTGARQMFRIVEQGMGRRSSSRRRHGTGRGGSSLATRRPERYRDRWPPSRERSSRTAQPGADLGADDRLIAAETLQLPHSCSTAVNFRHPGQLGPPGRSGRTVRAGTLPTVESGAPDQRDNLDLAPWRHYCDGSGSQRAACQPWSGGWSWWAGAP